MALVETTTTLRLDSLALVDELLEESQMPNTHSDAMPTKRKVHSLLTSVIEQEDS
jgi:hypothetical protein